VLVAVGPALAQPNLGAGSIGGAIRDESNAAVVGAKVILTENSKGLSASRIRFRGFCFNIDRRHLFRARKRFQLRKDE
jgi:hypothetical protein